MDLKYTLYTSNTKLIDDASLLGCTSEGYEVNTNVPFTCIKNVYHKMLKLYNIHLKTFTA